MPERAPLVSSSAAGPTPTVRSSLPVRNRRTALVLVVWIFVLMLASALVAWLRN